MRITPSQIIADRELATTLLTNAGLKNAGDRIYALMATIVQIVEQEAYLKMQISQYNDHCKFYQVPNPRQYDKILFYKAVGPTKAKMNSAQALLQELYGTFNKVTASWPDVDDTEFPRLTRSEISQFYKRRLKRGKPCRP